MPVATGVGVGVRVGVLVSVGVFVVVPGGWGVTTKHEPDTNPASIQKMNSWHRDRVTAFLNVLREVDRIIMKDNLFRTTIEPYRTVQGSSADHRALSTDRETSLQE